MNLTCTKRDEMLWLEGEPYEHTTQDDILLTKRYKILCDDPRFQEGQSYERDEIVEVWQGKNWREDWYDSENSQDFESQRKVARLKPEAIRKANDDFKELVTSDIIDEVIFGKPATKGEMLTAEEIAEIIINSPVEEEDLNKAINLIKTKCEQEVKAYRDKVLQVLEENGSDGTMYKEIIHIPIIK